MFREYFPAFSAIFLLSALWHFRLLSAIIIRFFQLKTHHSKLTMAIEAVKIPQNVYVEDHIIGPITLKQLGITGVGAGISYVIYSIVTKAGFIEVPIQVLCWIPAVIGAAFAFFKINDLSLFSIILLTIERMNKPNERYWSPSPGLSINLITRQTMKQMETSETKASDTTSKLAEMTRQMEKRQEEINHLAVHDIQKPSALEPVKTMFQDITAPAEHVIETADVPVTDASEKEPLSLAPVQPHRIKADGLIPAYSIDTIHLSVPTFRDTADVSF